MTISQKNTKKCNIKKCFWYNENHKQNCGNTLSENIIDCPKTNNSEFIIINTL